MQAATDTVRSTDIDQLCINTIRTLSIDAIEKANSGHPGTPMALAPLAYTLWQRYLRFDPADPIWPNRDRFVLSAGHASMLLYSLLHLAQVKSVDSDYETQGEPAISLSDIESFRQLDSKAAGHPEYRLASGIETTTGPLGQGIATSVGMAIAGQWDREHFGAELFDFDVYAVCGDGCLMEGVSSEAASIAGHQRLDNLCWIYDNNHITIDGHTEITYEDDVAARFLGYGWTVNRVGDANDIELISRAFERFQDGERPPDPDHRRQPHRLRLAAQAGHRGRPRRAARRRGGAGDEARLRLARGRPVPRPRRRLRALRRRDRRARRTPARRVAPARRRRRAGLSVADRPDAAARASRGLGLGDPRVRSRREGGRDPQGRPPGARLDRPQGSLAAERLRRPHRLGRERARLRRGGRLPAHRPGRAHPPLRDPRARVGGDLQRPLALEAAAGLVDVPDLLRLRPPGDPALGADGAAGDPLVQPRLDRARRGRPHPSAGRAARLAAGDPEPERDPPLRRQRGGGGLAGDHAAAA